MKPDKTTEEVEIGKSMRRKNANISKRISKMKVLITNTTMLKRSKAAIITKEKITKIQMTIIEMIIAVIEVSQVVITKTKEEVIIVANKKCPISHTNLRSSKTK